MKFRIATLTIASCVCTIANAGYITNVRPGSVRVLGPTGHVAFNPIGSTVIGGCYSNDFYIIKSANNAKMILALLLTANVTGRTIKIYVPDDATKCDAESGRPNVTDVTIED
jgi:hypothetical protein